MQFMELMKDKGWFTVEVKEVFIVSAITGEHIPVIKGGVINPFNTGKGTIVDEDKNTPEYRLEHVSQFIKFLNEDMGVPVSDICLENALHPNESR